MSQPDRAVVTTKERQGLAGEELRQSFDRGILVDQGWAQLTTEPFLQLGCQPLLDRAADLKLATAPVRP